MINIFGMTEKPQEEIRYMSRLWWMFLNLSSRLWFSASLYGTIAVVSALAAIYLKQFVPSDLPQKIGSDAVDSILNILASSMLSVTIFSLSTMVSAYSAATSNVTPRATKLLIEDTISHRALSTFLGAFIFSIVSIIALKTGLYGTRGRLVLFVVTVAIIIIIVITLLRWIEYLTRLGRVHETIQRVEKVATDSLEMRLADPYLGGTPLNQTDDIPVNATAIAANSIGYVQHIDMSHLSRLAEKHNAVIYIVALPGQFIYNALSIAYVTGVSEPEVLTRIRKGFITGTERSFRQDPRFGITVLREIASRALSPAVNDGGTAVQVIGTAVRILFLWAKRHELAQPGKAILYPRLHVPPLRIDDLFNDFFPPLARDAANKVEVHVCLQKAYTAFASTGDAELMQVAKQYSALSLEWANETQMLDSEKTTLKSYADSMLGNVEHTITTR